MWCPGCRDDGRRCFSWIQDTSSIRRDRGAADAADHHGTVGRRVFAPLPCRMVTARRRDWSVSHRLMPRLDLLVMLRIAGCTGGLASDLEGQEDQQERGTSGTPPMHGYDCNLMAR